MQPISTAIMTYNEEENIERCIRSVLSFSDEVLVVDSFSTDATAEIAKRLGAVVLQNKFEGYIEQRRFILEKAKHEFVFTIDADEEVSEILQKEILELKKAPKHRHYLINRLNKIGNSWIYHGAWHPDWKLRLFYKNEIKVEGAQPHDRIISLSAQKPKKLKGKLLHYSDKGIEDRMQTVNKHSSTAADSLFQKGKKTNGIRLLLKPAFRFFNEYFLKLGFLDGRIGYFLAKSNAQYVLLRELKLWERWKNQTDE